MDGKARQARADEPQFDPAMYRQLDADLGSRSGARVIAPMVLEMVSAKSVLDVGCGVGSWLAVFGELGVEDYVGVDSAFVQPDLLQIPADRFLVRDLRDPLEVGRRFDLVVCLEVAADLPEDLAPRFVADLARLAPAVLFSAAIPYQAGAGTGRVNQRWPSYWADLFAVAGMEVLDPFRNRIWRNPEVPWWYAQNVLLYATPELIAASPKLAAAREGTHRDQLSLVHPELFLAAQVFRVVAGRLPLAAAEAVKRRIGMRVADPGPY